MALDHDQFMRIALEEADKAGIEGNIAVGSVITIGDSVVARGRNLVSSTLDVTAHCETDALRNGGKALGHVDFSGHTLYTTAEPCPMCCGAIMASGMSTVVMGARPEPSQRRYGDYTIEKLIELAGFEHKLQVVTGILPQVCADVRRQWEERNASNS